MTISVHLLEALLAEGEVLVEDRQVDAGVLAPDIF